VAERPPQRAIIFLNAWSEWAEGNYVEPDAVHGHRYLDVIRRVIDVRETAPEPAAVEGLVPAEV
jgi:hypothetical protein